MSTAERDATDGVVEQWRERRPDLDAAPLAVLGRLQRVAVILDAASRPVFAPAGLSIHDFDLLATLRRAGEPMSPGRLARSMLVDSGPVAKRLDRLGRRGLVARPAAPEGARSRPVALTPAGEHLADELAERHWANEVRFLAPLDHRERDQLAELLRKLLAAHE